MAPGNRNHPKNAKWSESDFTVAEFMREFPDDETCLVWLWNTRYNLGDDTAHCDRCEQIRTFHRYHGRQQRQDWTCTACGLHVHPTAGTIFHKSSTSLQLWFYAIYLMTSTRCGISAKQLERELGVTYKTAWRMFTLIRNELMAQDDDEQQLSGEVEMDEMYVGGKPRQSDRAQWADQPSKQQAAQKWAAKKKTPVFGMVERGGKVRAYVVPKATGKLVMKHISVDVDPSASVFTDESGIYNRLADEGFYHQRIQHNQRVYVSGHVHTQTIDGFWSMVKRGISGTHYHVSAKWLQGYLNEYAWRYNRRGAAGEGLTRKDLFENLLVRAALFV